MRFSANLGFLWADLPLPEAIRAARRAGFDAVECHWPYAVPPGEVAAALAETGLEMLGLNTRRGNVAAGDNGLAAVPGRAAEARDAIDEAVAYGAAIGARNAHVMAGVAAGAAAHACFVANLAYACKVAAARGMSILIEPLNGHDAPGYFLTHTDQAAGIIAEVGADNLRLMFDCYHVQRTEGDVDGRIEALLPVIGHVQFAGVPARGVPDEGDLAYGPLFALLDRLGWGVPLGAEYRPDGPTADSLGWMARFRALS